MATSIERSAEHPWYWTVHDSPTMLIGGSDTDNLFQWTGEKLQSQLDTLVECGGNYVRNTMSDRKEGDVSAFAEIRPGLYDLDEWNEEYWNRLETFLTETANRDIIVQLTFWDQHDLGTDRWRTHPWNPSNNRSYTSEESGLPEELDIDSWNERSAFFRTVEEENERVLNYQQRFVNKILDSALAHDHVLYNVGNESWAGNKWERYWAEFVHDRAVTEGLSIDVTNMTMEPDDTVRKAIESPDLFTYVDLSQHNQDAMGSSDQEHWNRLQMWRSKIEDALGPRPLNNVKIYGGFNGGNSAAGDAEEAIERAWRNLIGGCASVRFHRPAGEDESWGIGLSERAQNQIEAMRTIVEAVEFYSLSPHQDILHDYPSNGAYCRADPGHEYVVYIPEGDPVEIQLTDASFSLRWLQTEVSEWVQETTVTGPRVSLRPPQQKNSVAIIRQTT